MDPIKQRIAIAEVCGIFICGGCNKQIDPECCHCGSPTKQHGYYDGHSPVPMGCVCGYHEANKMKSRAPNCPDYLNNLNAMHKAEETLKDWNKYVCMIAKVIVGDTRPKASGNDYHVATSVLIHATAAQRAEAFLRTIGKWQNS